MSSSHNRPVTSVIGGASQHSTAANSDSPTHGNKVIVNDQGQGSGYLPSTGRDKSLVDHAGKIVEEVKHQVNLAVGGLESEVSGLTSNTGTTTTTGKQVGGNQLFDKADGSEKEGKAAGGLLNKYTDEIAPGESTS